jgi:hypothetical protein
MLLELLDPVLELCVIFLELPYCGANSVINVRQALSMIAELVGKVKIEIFKKT